MNSGVGIGLAAMALLVTSWSPAARASASGQVQVLDRQGIPVDRLTDGDTIRIRVALAQSTSQAMPIEMWLEGVAQPVANCTVAAAEEGCTTESLAALG